jgi:maleamate amidohydrolase
MPIWDDLFSEHEKKVFEKAGYGRKREFGQHPALMIIDVSYHFVGDQPEPILRSIERFPASCGEVGWRAVHQIASILPRARGKRIPIIYSTGEPSLPSPWKSGSRREEMNKIKTGHDIVKEIAPEGKDIVIRKLAPSIFFGTPLASILFSLRVDTLFVCGGVTSGCVRASVVDAASYGFNVGVIEECTFDRSEVSHKVSLFDMNAKYASVLSVRDFEAYVRSLGSLNGE